MVKNYKSLFAKVFNLGSKFNFMKGLLANMLVIITLATLLQISPKFIEFCYQKGIFFLLIQVHSNFSKYFKIL